MGNIFKKYRFFLWCLLAAGIIALDQLTKFFAVTYLKPIGTLPLIRDVFHLTYLTNEGAAFGMLQNHRWVFMSISCAAILIIAIILWRIRNGNKLLCTSLSFIVGGGIGNMIDRFALGYVIDFLHFKAIDFPIFNVADSFVCIGGVLFAIYLFKYEKEKPNVPNKAESDAEHGRS